MESLFVIRLIIFVVKMSTEEKIWWNEFLDLPYDKELKLSVQMSKFGWQLLIIVIIKFSNNCILTWREQLNVEIGTFSY
jgi:hypothetical protein